MRPSEPRLLTRDAFRAAVLSRDARCVGCRVLPSVDAHHLMERRLWPDGGYYVENGVGLCAGCHLRAESTEVGPDELRERAGIRRVLLPPQLYDDAKYDKWANPILENGTRLRGELFFDESVQKVIAPFLPLFVDRVKYPRTYHLPWSPGMTKDDRVIPDTSAFEGRRVVVTEKMDGENTTMARDYIHARSVDGRSHPSRDWVKGLWGRVRADIPEGWRLCGENLYATHSIPYRDLPSFFLGFSIWNERNVRLDWEKTRDYFALLGLDTVPILYEGVYDEARIRALYDEKRDRATREGYVVTTAEGFPFADFRRCTAKFVRAGHAQTTPHWMHGQAMRRNVLRIEKPGPLSEA